jgi:hypothetical protein
MQVASYWLTAMPLRTSRRLSSSVAPKAGMMTMSSGVSVSQSSFVSLQVTQTAAEEVLVDEGIVNQLGEHEHAAAGIFREGFVGPLDRISHAQAETEVTRNHVTHRAEIERDRRGGGALVLPGQRFDRGAQLRLIERARRGVLRVDRSVALFFRAKFINEIVFSEMEIGNLDQVGLELLEEHGEGGSERRGIFGQFFNREKFDLAVNGDA